MLTLVEMVKLLREAMMPLIILLVEVAAVAGREYTPAQLS